MISFFLTAVTTLQGYPPEALWVAVVPGQLAHALVAVEEAVEEAALEGEGANGAQVLSI